MIGVALHDLAGMRMRVGERVFVPQFLERGALARVHRPKRTLVFRVGDSEIDIQRRMKIVRRPRVCFSFSFDLYL